MLTILNRSVKHGRVLVRLEWCLLASSSRNCHSDIFSLATTAAIFKSKAQVSSYCVELANKLGMRYKSPPLPVDLFLARERSSNSQIPTRSVPIEVSSTEEVAAMFEIR
jgi:hypothetical protein